MPLVESSPSLRKNGEPTKKKLEWSLEEIMNYMRISVSLAATLWLLIIASDVLKPLMIAGFVVLLINALAATVTRSMYGPDRRPSRLSKGVSALFFVCLFLVLTSLVATNAAELRDALPLYEANLDALIATVAERFGLQGSFGIVELIAKIDLTSVFVGIAGTAASFIGAAIVILFYTIFIFVEEGVVEKKLAAIVSDPERRGEVEEVISKINREIERYLGIKLILGIVQAAPTYLILHVVGVDAAVFWTVIIFFFSFIPTVGTLVGITFPSLMALVQFDTPQPFLIVLGTLASIQLLASNGLEPRLMGKSLNLSPLAIFLAIFAGGAIWGIVGALIVVPMLAVSVIVLARVPSMRPVAILLSSDGDIEDRDASDAGFKAE
jgi:predicted PurR-regulated permease PerM